MWIVIIYFVFSKIYCRIFLEVTSSAILPRITICQLTPEILSALHRSQQWKHSCCSCRDTKLHLRTWLAPQSIIDTCVESYQVKNSPYNIVHQLFVAFSSVSWYMSGVRTFGLCKVCHPVRWAHKASANIVLICWSQHEPMRNRADNASEERWRLSKKESCGLYRGRG